MLHRDKADVNATLQNNDHIIEVFCSQTEDHRGKTSPSSTRLPPHRRESEPGPPPEPRRRFPRGCERGTKFLFRPHASTSLTQVTLWKRAPAIQPSYFYPIILLLPITLTDSLLTSPRQHSQSLIISIARTMCKFIQECSRSLEPDSK